MITKEHRDIKFSDNDGHFVIVSASEEEMFQELREFCNSNNDRKVGFYRFNVRPSKENYRPEYAMEVVIMEDGILYPFYNRAR
jgi:hypothetical protein